MDTRESFPILETATGAGSALRQVQIGDDPLAKNGSLGFAFRDSAGNVVMPQLSGDGRLPVTMEAAGTHKKGFALVAGSQTEVTVLEVTLVANKTYVGIKGKVSCFAEGVFRLFLSDNAVETELDATLVGPGQYTADIGLPKLEVTAGGTGVQKLIIKAINPFNKTSDFRASLEAIEVA